MSATKGQIIGELEEVKCCVETLVFVIQSYNTKHNPVAAKKALERIERIKNMVQNLEAVA